MANTIQLKRTPSSFLPSDLSAGEPVWINGLKLFAIQGTDGNLYPVGGEGFISNVSISALAPAESAINAGGQRITNLSTTNLQDTDAAPVEFVKNLVQGLDAKNSVRCASVANINLASPGATIDGYTMTVGDRYLVKNQTTATQNGIYVWNGSAIASTRSEDFSFTNQTVSSRAYVYVENGTTNKGSGWTCSNTDPITTSDPISWMQFNGGGGTVTTFPPLYIEGSTVKLGYSSLLFGVDTANKLIIAGGNAGNVLVSNGSSEASFKALDLSTVNFSGVLPVVNGGTGASSLEAGIVKSDGSDLLKAIPHQDYLTNTSVLDGGTY